MASSKEMHQSSRPFAHTQRPPMPTMIAIQTPASAPAVDSMNISTSISTVSSGLLSRPTHIRTPSHSLSSLVAAPLNVHNRISRRKSVTAGPQANIAAVAAIIEGNSPLALPVPSSKRYMSAMSMAQTSSGTRPGFAVLPTPPSSLPSSDKFPLDVKPEPAEQNMEAVRAESGVIDGPSLVMNSTPTLDPTIIDDKTRIRRASEGQPLVREGGKRFNRIELRCDRCGKSYKHSSCLTKHLWEHTPEWQLTSKLLISKHQQVQLLEAASVLVSMNNDAKTDVTALSPPDSTPDFSSESESISDSVTNITYRHSSSETTPPPLEGLGTKSNYYQISAKRYSTGGISKAYKSSNSHRASILSISPSSSFLAHGRKRSEDLRPSSSGRNSTGKDDRELAAAVEQLSCSYGRKAKSPKLLGDLECLDTATSYASSGFFNSYPSRLPESFARGTRNLHNDDAQMGDSDNESIMGDDDDYDMQRARSEEDDDGIFGRMEE